MSEIGSKPVVDDQRSGTGKRIREIMENDLDGLLRLYTQLHNNPFPEKSVELNRIWSKIISDPDYHIIICEDKGVIISSCVCVIVPNLTHEQRPYALIENVITDEKYRNKGYATACLDFAKDIAKKENCYKIMLMTGSKKESTLHFYQQAGYNSNDKTAFICWL